MSAWILADAVAYPLLELERLADPDGRWIPMAVRMKLDLAGLKISLEDWQALEATARERLMTLRAETRGSE